ncbi:uncharacterized protein BJ171DRAFT_251761 [Polychytrium aggregatum]|uniref:uncharacterized protein n=1 Tax=Polychytrium aggregatum TaxID=110093 RepID=UPI0022FE0D62|nr:uncharacterized protein BJ171DRAFT_251761 [Polychytrium aggregatum]KAI9193599.1 hypothetical protein BJ171DRAFT_251761 [Polychytrium aggregatum]
MERPTASGSRHGQDCAALVGYQARPDAGTARCSSADRANMSANNSKPSGPSAPSSSSPLPGPGRLFSSEYGVTNEPYTPACILSPGTLGHVNPGDATGPVSSSSGLNFDEGDDDDDDEDEEEWMQIDVVHAVASHDDAGHTGSGSDLLGTSSSSGPLEIAIPKLKAFLDKDARKQQRASPKTKGITKEDRDLRMAMHKAHLLCLLICGSNRNIWCHDPELQNVARSAIPRQIAESLTRLSSRASGISGQQNVANHRYLIHYLRLLAIWWKRDIKPSFDPDEAPPSGVGSVMEKFGRFLSRPPSQEGSKTALSPEVSAILFVAAMRGIGLDARLAVSLHPIPLSFSGELGRMRKADESPDNNPGGSNPNDVEGSVTAPASDRRPTKRRKTNSAKDAGEIPFDDDRFIMVPYPLTLWCEVHSPHCDEWIPVDPNKGMVDRPLDMAPGPNKPLQLQLSYIVAYGPLRECKDVTRRYAPAWGAQTSRNRLPAGLEGEEWWNRALWLLSMSERDTDKDAREEQFFREQLRSEKMPTRLAGFNNHPLFALERHCKRNEVIWPAGKENMIGQYKGEPVYPRRNVQEALSVNGWLRRGRSIKPDEKPAKIVPVRQASIQRRRDIEHEASNRELRLLDDEQGDVLIDSSKIGLFGIWQTELYKPPIIEDGIIPKNQFGNIEILHESMVPIGGVHIKVSGLGKVAQKLNIDYANAVTGFEFNKGKSTPVYQGIVVAEEYQEILLEAYREITIAKDRKQAEQKAVRALGNWTKLVNRLLLRSRIRETYMK